jgi:hypothetical protein
MRFRRGHAIQSFRPDRLTAETLQRSVAATMIAIPNLIFTNTLEFACAFKRFFRPH